MAAQADVERLKAKVERLRRELEAENPQLRRDLIANVAHDLRTPRVSLHGYLEMLAAQGDALPAKQRAQYVAIALRPWAFESNKVFVHYSLPKKFGL